MMSQDTKTAFPWLDALHFDPIPALLRAAPLHIRYQLYRDILEDLDSETLQSFRKNLRKQKTRRSLLNSQNESGLWPVNERTKGLSARQIETLQYLRQVEVLSELLDLQITRKQTKAVLGLREVIRFLDGDHQGLRLHQLNQGIYLAIKLEMDGNPIIKQLIWDTFKQQNPDGGWSSLAGEESCLWTSLHFLWVMGHSSHFQHNRTLLKGLEYVRSNLLQGDKSKLLPGMQAWDTLLTGHVGLSVLHGGTLRFLEAVQLLQPETRDRNNEKLLDWLLSIQLKNSLWPAIAGRDKLGNHEVTLRVLRVVKHFQSLRLRDTLEYDD